MGTRGSRPGAPTPLESLDSSVGRRNLWSCRTLSWCGQPGYGGGLQGAEAQASRARSGFGVPFPPFCVTVPSQDTGPQGARAHSQKCVPAHKSFLGVPLTPMLGLRVPVQLEVKKPHSAGLGLGGRERSESSQLCLHLRAFALEVTLGWAQQGGGRATSWDRENRRVSV